MESAQIAEKRPENAKRTQATINFGMRHAVAAQPGSAGILPASVCLTGALLTDSTRRQDASAPRVDSQNLVAFGQVPAALIDAPSQPR